MVINKVLLVSNDNEQFEVDRGIIRLSSVLNDIFKDVGMDEPGGSDNSETVPLADVDGVILRKVIEWCERHKDDPPNKNYNEFSSWDDEFLKMDRSTLFEIILAANYLGIDGLMTVVCNKVGDILRGKSVEGIKDLFNMRI
uniref:Skp1-related protein n=1 Tax=Meloidogyne enterolobii TaxID=390850 RepID=A0A6V7WB31_MELEN|nr:unnamed protein product [Meloidogyne enterolobii]